MTFQLPDQTDDEIQIFNDFTENEIKEIFRISQVCHYPEEAIVFEESSHDTAIYVVLRGEFEVLATMKTGEKTVLSTITEGTVFGEMSFLDDLPRSATVRAKSDAEALRITKSDFASLMETSPTTATKFFQDFARVVSLRLRHADAFIVQMLGTFKEDKEQAVPAPAEAAVE